MSFVPTGSMLVVFLPCSLLRACPATSATHHEMSSDEQLAKLRERVLAAGVERNWFSTDGDEGLAFSFPVRQCCDCGSVCLRLTDATTVMAMNRPRC